MSFHFVRDISVDSAKATQHQTIPVNSPSTITGSIEFNTLTNTFVGMANKCQVPMSTLVVTTIQTGVTPAGIGILPNGRKAYIANNNNYGATYEGGASCNSVTVVDLSTYLPIKTIVDTSFNQPYTITISIDGTKAYVTNSNSTTITIINTVTDTVSGIISGFDGPSGMVITPNGLVAYVNNYGVGLDSGNGTTVSVVNLLTNMIVGSPITVGQAPASLAISPNGLYVYVINYMTGVTDGTISVITTSNNSSIVDALSGFSGPFGIAINSAGTTAYVTNFGSNNFSPFGTTLSIVDLTNPTSPTITNTLTIGIQPSGVAVTPDGKFLYVSNYNTLYSDNVHFTGLTPGEGTVNIIDLQTLEILGTVVVGQSPNFICMSPGGTIALVSNFISNTVSVLAVN